MPSELSEQEREALDYLVRMALGHDYADGVKITEAEFTIETGFARIRDEAVKAAERALRERVEAVIEATSFLGSFGESGPYIAVTDVRAAVAAGSSPSEETHASYYSTPSPHRGRREDCRICPPSPSEEAWGRETPHTLTEYGTTNCAVEHVRAEVNDGECSACGAQVPAPSEKRCHCGDSLCTCAYPEPPRCDDENCHGECDSPAPSEGDAEERGVHRNDYYDGDGFVYCQECYEALDDYVLISDCPARLAPTEGSEG